MRYIIKDTEKFTESAKSQDRKKRIAVPVVSVLAICALLALLEVLNPGTVAYLFSLVKALVLAIWGMLGDVADAIGDFFQYVQKLRS